MMSANESEQPILSMEAIEAGVGAPNWLLEAIVSGQRLMVIHSTEASRKQTISDLHNMIGGGIVDSSHHLTIQRLISMLHIDLRLPAVMEDDGVTFELTHQALSSHAADYGFPLLQPNPQNVWTRSRSHRILSLHREIISLLKPHNWEEDPGAISCDKALKKLENKTGMTHPSRRARVVLDAITETDQIPFSLRDLSGIIMLDHASSLSEVEIAIMSRISQLVNLHQLVNPGSHRLGYHGEYIEDIHPVRKQSDLPNWVPEHKVWIPKQQQGWKSPNSNSNIYHLMVESENQSISAIGDLLSRVEGDVMIVDGDSSNLRKKLSSHLENQGFRLRGENSTISSSPAVSRILSIIGISRGEEAWSLTRLTDLVEQIGLPMTWGVMNLEHPTDPAWKPKLHPETLVEIARGFHILGGRGSLRRWLSTLSQATPRFTGDEDQSRALEESQWWLAAMSRWMAPILSKQDREVAMQKCIGCISGEELPLPELIENPIIWFNSLLEQIDWRLLAGRDSVESNSIPGLQYFIESLTRLTQEMGLDFEGDDFYEMLQHLASNTQLPSRRGTDTGIRILNPNQALGTTSDTLILSGLNSNKWSMKSPSVPWLDEMSRMRLGINRPDDGLRKGRHHLRHLLNSSKTVVILDSSLQDGIEPAGPLEEWFSTISTDEDELNLENPPSFIDSNDWKPDTPDRSWSWQTIPDIGLRLVHKVSSMEMLADGVRTHRSGKLPRDELQRAGLASIEGREITSQPLNQNSILEAVKKDLLPDQYNRRKGISSFDVGEIFPFEDSGKMIRTKDYRLIPNRNNIPSARDSSQWPHLGEVTEKKAILGIDPRPILPSSTGIKTLDERTGITGVSLRLPKIWSQSRLQAWLFCPRKAWIDRHLRLGQEEKVPEDLAANARGNIVHFVEEAVLRAHGVEDEQIAEQAITLAEGPLKDINDAWQVVLKTLMEKAPWMKRADGVAAHRCRDLIGVSPSQWVSWLEGEETIPVGGRLGRMIQADFGLRDCAPIASEWEVRVNSNRNVTIVLPSSPEQETEEKSFKITGFIDKVDEVLVDYELEKEAETIPLDLNLKQHVPVSKLVIIRDIKSMDGPKDDGKEARHLKGLFDEVQLALYARAWEIGNPGHRVIGIGVTQVGIDTHPWVELDPDFIDLLSESKVGIVTQSLVNQYRRPGESTPAESNPFRAWMRERITTANRVIENAEAGKIPCNCPTIGSCLGSKRGGW
ncbi:MAG: hypothetical protein CMB76_00510 [Euryarchaeota archaeon]|nr:hypothetical protein [Euryarchaeota archaeon]